MKKQLTALVCALSLALTPMAALAAEDPYPVEDEAVRMRSAGVDDTAIVPMTKGRLSDGVIWYVTSNGTILRRRPEPTNINNIKGYLNYNDKCVPDWPASGYRHVDMISGNYSGYDGYVPQNQIAKTNYGYLSIGEVIR